MAPKDQGAQGGQRARRARQQGEHHPAGTGEPRRSCRERTVSWGGEVARRSRSSRPRSPEPLQPPPSLLLEPRQEPRAPRPPSPKKSGPWVPRAGDFVAKSGFPHSAVLSQEPRAGAGAGGGEITAPSSSVGRKSSTLTPRPRPGYPDPSLPSTPPWDPKPQHPPSRVSAGRTHLGPGTLGPGRTGWLVHVWRGPCGVDQGPAEGKDAGAQARGQSQEEEALESGSGGKAFQREQDGPTRQRQQSAQRLKSGDTQATAQRGTSRGSARPLGPRGSGGRRRGWGEC